MLTYKLWKDYTEYDPDALTYLYCLVASILYILLDVVLSPFELIAFIMFKIKEGKR